MKLTKSAIVVALIAVGAVTAKEQEYPNGLNAEKLAQFAYPDYSLVEALEILHDEAYADPDTYDSIKSFYAKDLSNRIKALGLPEQETLSILAKPLNEQDSFLDMKSREQANRSRNSPKVLTGTTYVDAAMEWDQVPVKRVDAQAKIIGEIDAISLNSTNIKFDLDKVTRGPERLILSRFSLCNVDTDLASPCSREGYSRFQPIPINRSEMLVVAQNERQAALPAPTTPSGKMTPAEARGLYEAAKHYQARNPGTELLLSITTDFKKLSSNDGEGVARSLKSYAETWGYKGIFLDNPAVLEGNSHSYMAMIDELRAIAPEMLIGVNLYNSHQLEEWDKDQVQELRDKVDFFRVVLNHNIDDEDVGQQTAFAIASDMFDRKSSSFAALFHKLQEWEIPGSKIVAFVEGAWDSRYYSSVNYPTMSCSWNGDNPNSRCSASESWSTVNNVFGSADRSKTYPGTLAPGTVYHYDLQNMLKQDGFNLSQKYDVHTFSDFYSDDTNKLILTGNNQIGAYDKAVYAGAIKMAGLSLRLEHDNGNLMKGVVDGINDYYEQEGKTLTLSDENKNSFIIKDIMYSSRAHWVKLMRAKAADNVMIDERYANVITVDVFNEDGEKFPLQVFTQMYDSITNKWISSESWSRWVDDYVYDVNFDYRQHATTDFRINLANQQLPPGRYRTQKPIEYQWLAHHEGLEWGDNQPFRTIFVDIDVTF